MNFDGPHDKYGYHPSRWQNYDKITMVCSSLNPDMNLLNKMIESAKGFDEIILHIDIKSKLQVDPERWLPVKIVIHYQHLSIPEAYNWMINEYVDTEWVCCFCDDDYFYPEALSQMVDQIHIGNARDCEIAHFKFHVSGYMPPQDIRGMYHKVFGNGEYDLCEKKRITPELLETHNRLPAASFFRKNAWEKVGGFQGDKCHDWDLWKRMAEAGCKFKYFDHNVYNFVRRKNSAWCKQNA